MALRCLLFSTDETTAEPLRRVLMELGVEGEYCPSATDAAERVTSQPLQIVILDWDDLPDAELLLKTARERKAAERPLTLAIVSSDASVPAVLQAGANSILRKPIQLNQAKDTLTTARDLLRAKTESATPAARAAAAAAAAAPAFSVTPPPEQETEEKKLRAGEFLSSAATPATHFDTESELHKASLEPTIEEMDPLKDLEPTAASMETQETPVDQEPEPPTEKRSLEWYLKARGAKMAPAPMPQTPGKAELLGFDQTPSHREVSAPEAEHAPTAHTESAEHKHKEQKSEAALFAYIDGEGPQEKESRKKSAPARPWIRKVLFAAVVAAICGVAYVEVPPEAWGKNLHFLASYVKHWGHAWLNPQPVAPQQAPPSHESFGRAGDEYKLPTAETIPDATTDPSKIQVAPVIDPTAKQPNNGINPVALNSQNSVAPGGTDQTPQTPVDPNQAPPQTTPNTATPTAVDPTSTTPAQTPPPAATPLPAANNPLPQAQPLPPATAQPAPQRNPEPSAATESNSKVPSSLKSQMASMTPEASGNKPPEAALPAIEPVDLPEATARGLLLQQTQPAYPVTARGQQGTVILQVLIGRDGSVQDAKFLQGSLAFARPAIDAVQQWRFKPYLMNGRPVSTKTVLTLSFKP